MSTKALKFTTLLFLLMLAMVVPLHAASNGSITIDTANTPTDQTPGDCNEVTIDYLITLTADTNDGDGSDWVAVAITDGNGKALDTDFFNYLVGPIIVDDDSLDSFRPDAITARPITFALYDTGDPGSIGENTIEGHNFAVAGRLMAQTVIDPATLTVDGSCESLPFGSTSSCPPLPAGSVVGNTPYPTQIYWAPDKVSPGVILNPGNYWVIGVDESGKYYKIMLSCDFVWVPIVNFQPSFEAPWNGQPLPTTIVK